jgi:hypothetical protein
MPYTLNKLTYLSSIVALAILSGCGGGGGTTPTNQAPVFTSSTSATVAENQTNAITLTATDADNDTLTYSISGTDASSFTINPTTGVVTFSTAPDFETKSSYSFVATVNDGTTTTNQNVTITISDVNETIPDTSNPVFTSAPTFSVAENQTSGFTAIATDSSAITYSISGTDASAFSINPTSGVVTFNTAPDYETKNSYSLSVTATDSSNNTQTQNVTVNITDVDESQTAYLIDSAVEGIDYYACGVKTGTTDTTGKFTYDTEKCLTGVEFKIGSLSLGTINPSAINTDTYLTLQDLAGVSRDNVTDGNVTKLAVLLQSLDNDNNATNGIVITDTIKGYFGTDENLSSKTDSELSTLITTAGKTEKDVNDALTHLLSTLTSKSIITTANINPTDFTIANKTGMALGSEAISDTITIAGLTIPTYITISNGEYSLDNGTTWKSTKSLVSNGQTVKVRHTTANSLSGTTTTTLKIGGVTKTFGSTTAEINWKGLLYNTITSSVTGKVWLDRNLGATQVCTESNDTACYGDYYQWGRETDGHQVSNSVTSSTLATDLNTTGNNNSSFITNDSNARDWTTLDSDGALRSANWSKTDGTSVCPVGYRVPTIEELLAENISNSADAYTKLKLPSAGVRGNVSCSLENQDFWGYIWSSSPFWSFSKGLYFESSADWGDFYRAFGQSVRCIKN